MTVRIADARITSVSLDWDEKPLTPLDELKGAALRVDYSRPGFYEWRVPGGGADWLQWVAPSTEGGRAPRAPIRGRTREAVLQEARRIATGMLEAMHRVALRVRPEWALTEVTPRETQIVPTELNLTILYLPSAAHDRAIRVFSLGSQSAYGTW